MPLTRLFTRLLTRVPPAAAAIKLPAFLALLLAGGVVRGAPPPAPEVEPQRTIAQVERMPNLPVPLAIRDWKRTALDYDRLAFDPAARGPYLPLLWFDDSRRNFPWTGFGLPSYVGQTLRPGGEEGINCLAAVLGATLVGVDKAQGTHDWVRMSEQFFNRANGQDVVLNKVSAGTGGSFWYELWPNILFDGLAYYYPHVPHTDEIMRTAADRWRAATAAVTGGRGVADFDHTAINLRTMMPVDNGHWKEPDGAAGIADLEVLAYARYGDPRSLQAAEAALRFLEGRPQDPLYEILLPYGAYAAARLNAEQGRDYDVGKLLDWSFGPSQARPGWGVIVGRWGGYDCDGLAGSVTDSDGYAFTMNTFALAGALVPLARYDPRYARAVGKWLLNAANAARLFYPDALPPAQQSGPVWPGDPAHAVAFEGLRHHGRDASGQDQSPFATGDAVRSGWAPTDLGLYGSSHVGFFGGIIQRTNDPAVLRLDCLKTDFFHQKAYPTYLYYNPHSQPVRVRIAVGPKAVQLYDAVTHRVLRPRAKGDTAFDLPPDTAAVIVLAPAAARPQIRQHTLFLGNIGVDFRVFPKNAL